MNTFNRVMIACDLSEMDVQVMKYIKLISDLINIKKTYFIHIMPDVSLPRNTDIEFHKLFSTEYPVDEKIENKIQLDIEGTFGEEKNMDFDIEVVEGQPYQKLIHWAGIKEIGLLVVGRKQESKGSGITTKRVARHAKSNILFVPENSASSIHKILVPLDFSENSARALKVALDIQKRSSEKVDIHAVHIIDLPPADYYMRPTENTGFIKMLEDSAKKAYNEFVNKNDWGMAKILPVFVENMFNNTAEHLSDYVEKENVDLVIMGAQGHSAINSFFFGSVTERFLNKNSDKPIFIIR